MHMANSNHPLAGERLARVRHNQGVVGPNERETLPAFAILKHLPLIADGVRRKPSSVLAVRTPTDETPRLK